MLDTLHINATIWNEVRLLLVGMFSAWFQCNIIPDLMKANGLSNSLLNNTAYPFPAIHKVLVNSLAIHIGIILLMDKERKLNCSPCGPRPFRWFSKLITANFLLYYF